MSYSAIETRFHGPTDTRGARVSARFMVRAGTGWNRGSSRVTVPYRHDLNTHGAHAVAADALLDRWNAGGGQCYRKAACGATDTGYVWLIEPVEG